MKKIINVFILLLMSFLLISCSKKETSFLYKNGLNEFEFINYSNEYDVEDGNINLLFKNSENIPYVNLEEFIYLLEGVYETKYFDFSTENNTLLISYEITYGDETYFETLSINEEENNISLNNMDFFSLYLKQTETDYSEGLVNLEPIIIKGDKVTYDLGKYNYEVLIEDDKYYLPLSITNLLFNQENYFDVYFNGETLYGIDTSKLDTSIMEKIVKSKYNNEKEPLDVREESYNYFAFLIDYFYGLKEERNIDDGLSFLNEDDFLKGSLNQTIFDYVNKLDDLHSSYLYKGYFGHDLRSYSYDQPQGTGIYTKGFYNNISRVQSEAIDYFGIKGNSIDIPTHEIINGDTLVIYLLEFTVDTPNEVNDILKETDENVENVIIDLTFNTGGNLGAVLRILTLMTEDEVWYHTVNKLDNAKMSYGVIGDKEKYTDFNYFVKTSSITFSAANLFASIAKELEIPVMGKKSSGGASPIGFHVFPNGSIINISSTNVLSNDNYESIELGIEPNYRLETYYNKVEINNIVNS